MVIDLDFKTVKGQEYLLLAARNEQGLHFIVGITNNGILAAGDYGECKLESTEKGNMDLYTKHDDLLLESVNLISEGSGFLTSFDAKGRVNTTISQGFDTKVGTQLVIQIIAKYADEPGKEEEDKADL